MSLGRARPDELAVRGNYLCTEQCWPFFFFFKQKILYLQILEGTLQYFAGEIRVFSYTECYLVNNILEVVSMDSAVLNTSCWGPLN